MPRSTRPQLLRHRSNRRVGKGWIYSIQTVAIEVTQDHSKVLVIFTRRDFVAAQMPPSTQVNKGFFAWTNFNSDQMTSSLNLGCRATLKPFKKRRCPLYQQSGQF